MKDVTKFNHNQWLILREATGNIWTGTMRRRRRRWWFFGDIKGVSIRASQALKRGDTFLLP